MGRPHPFEICAGESQTLGLVDLPLIRFEPLRDAAFDEIRNSLVNRYIHSGSKHRAVVWEPLELVEVSFTIGSVFLVMFLPFRKVVRPTLIAVWH
jgi:hypothetical protein